MRTICSKGILAPYRRYSFHFHLDFSTSDTMEGQLKAKLLDQIKQRGNNEREHHVTAVVGANGMGGVGKTTALCKLAQEREVREAFPDGIHFMVVGKDATPGSLVQRLKSIVRKSGGERLAEEIQDTESLRSAVATTSSWFAGRKVLLICDDLWQTPASQSGYYNELRELLSECPQSHMIISTRNDKIGPQGSPKVVFEPRPTTGGAARGIFLKSAGLNDTDLSTSGVNDLVVEVLKLCRGVPLTLSIAGAQIRSHGGTPMESLEYLLWYIREEALPIRQEETAEEYPCFDKIVRGSLEGIASYLEKNDYFMRGLHRHMEQRKTDTSMTMCEFVVDRFHRLSILPRNPRVPARVLFGVWCISDVQLGWKLLRALKDSHLILEFGGTKDEMELVYGVHDVILDHSIDESSYRGRNQYSMFHRDFLNHMCESNGVSTNEDCKDEMNAFWKSEECEKCRPWWDFFSNRKPVLENYILGNLFRHLREGARLAEAVGLLSHKRWTEVWIKYGEIAALNADFRLVESAMNEQLLKNGAPEKSASKIAVEGIKRIREMIGKEWPRISKHPECNPSEAFWYFTIRNEKRSWIVERYLASAEMLASTPWLKPRPTSLNISGTLDNTFDAAEGIRDISVMWVSKQIIVATCTRLFWVDMETMRTTRSENIEAKSISLCEKKNLLVLELVSGQLQFRNATTGELLNKSLPTHGSMVASSADGRELVLSNVGATFSMWDVENEARIGESMLSLSDDDSDGVVTEGGEIAISANGRKAVSGYDGTLQIWDLESGGAEGEPLHLVDDLDEWPFLPDMKVGISADGRTIVSKSLSAGVMRVWGMQSETAVPEPLLTYRGKVRCLAISGDGRTVASSFGDGTLRLWKKKSETVFDEPLVIHKGDVDYFAISADGGTVVYASWDGKVGIWEDMGVGNAPDDSLVEHKHLVSRMALSLDGRRVICGFRDGMVRVWKMDSGTAPDELLLEQEHSTSNDSRVAHVTRVAINADGRRGVSSSRYKVRTWDVECNTALAEISAGPDNPIESLAMSGDGQKIVFGYYDGTVQVWDVERETADCEPLLGHKESVGCVAISADGRTVASACWYDRTVRVWGVEHGRAVSKAALVHFDVLHVALSADGRRVLSCSYYGDVQLWDVQSAAPIG